MRYRLQPRRCPRLRFRLRGLPRAWCAGLCRRLLVARWPQLLFRRHRRSRSRSLRHRHYHCYRRCHRRCRHRLHRPAAVLAGGARRR